MKGELDNCLQQRMCENAIRKSASFYSIFTIEEGKVFLIEMKQLNTVTQVFCNCAQGPQFNLQYFEN